MKKNVFMRAALLLLVLTLITSCFVGGTFAKYTTSGDAGDSARVAKWGVTVAVSGNTAFKDDYETTDTNTYAGTYSVSSSGDDGDAVLAPGTSGDLGSIKVSGTPEVAVIVETVVDLELGAGWKYNSGAQDEQDSLYFPVVFSVAGTPVDVSGCADLAAIETAIETAIIDAIMHTDATLTVDGTGNKSSVTYAPNSAELADATAIELDWAWAFQGEDVKDTYLGNNTDNVTISLSISVSVTQVD